MFEQVDSEIYLLINNEQQANPDILTSTDWYIP